MKTVKISTEYITLAQLLKLCGAAMTGGEAKELIQGGRVTVNGETCLMRGKKLRGGERIGVGGESYEVSGCT